MSVQTPANKVSVAIKSVEIPSLPQSTRSTSIVTNSSIESASDTRYSKPTSVGKMNTTTTPFTVPTKTTPSEQKLLQQEIDRYESLVIVYNHFPKSNIVTLG
jgi:hypothetical protein